MAKEQNPEQAPAPAPTPAVDAPEALGPPKSYRMQIMLGFAGIILFQVVVLYMFTPRQPAPEWRGGIDPRNGPSIYGAEGTAPPSVMPKVDMLEKTIKETPFKYKGPGRDDPESTEVFSLGMHVKIRKKDERKFDTRFGECKNEIIDRITTVLQTATSEQRQELGFTTIKAKAKKAINEVLGIPYVQLVMTSEPSYETL